MKRRELERHLRAHGARLLREGGSHSFWGIDAERSAASLHLIEPRDPVTLCAGEASDRLRSVPETVA